MPSTNLTRRALSLGARDTVTGWCKKTWTDTTIQGVVFDKSSQLQALSVGAIVRTDALLLTDDAVVDGDEIKTAANRYYEIKAARPMYNADSFDHYECDLHYESLHFDIDYTTYAGVWLRDDARKRTKTWIETWWTAANADDDAGNALTIQCIYAPVPYPLKLEIYDGSTNDVLMVLGKAKTAAIPGHDHSPIGYEEQIPIGIVAMDKTSVTADKAITQCETELRNIMETHPLGSVRTLIQTTPMTEVLGSNTLYQIQYLMNYQRDKT